MDHSNDYMMYVWAAYGIACLILAILTLSTVRRFKKLRRDEQEKQNQ